MLRTPCCDRAVAHLNILKTFPRGRHLRTYILLQVRTSNNVTKDIPLLAAWMTGSVNMYIIVCSERFAWVGVGWSHVLQRHAVANTTVRMTVCQIRLPLGAGQTDHEILHRDINSLANALLLLLQECGNNGQSHHRTGSGVRYRDA